MSSTTPDNKVLRAKVSLRVTVPLMLMVFTTLIGAWSVRTNGRRAAQEVEVRATEELRRLMHLLQGVIDQELAENEPDDIQELSVIRLVLSD